MAKKYDATQDIVNNYPSWSKTRYSDQSLGFRLINALARPIDYMDKEFRRARDNQYTMTTNLDEIDILYRVSLPTTFSFEQDTTDIGFPTYVEPTVSGYDGSTWRTVSIADDNDIQSFWYTSIPDRVSLNETVSGVNYELYSFTGNTTETGSWEHHLDGGHLYITVSGGDQYISEENGNIVRAQLILNGETRKYTDDPETVVFPWDLTQKTFQEWNKITKITTHDFQDTVTFTIKSAQFNSGPYPDFWNDRVSENRNSIDTFWDVGTVESHSTLDLIEYVTDDWQQLVIGLTDKQVVKSWELFDSNWNSLSPVDMTIQPFSNWCWIAESSKVHLFDLADDTISGVELLLDKTDGPDVQLEFEYTHYVRDEEITFLLFHARPLATIDKYRIWYQTPSGTKYGLLNGSQVSYTSNFWVGNLSTTVNKEITGVIQVTAAELGEYVFVAEVNFEDGTTQTDKVVVSVGYKQPLVSFDLSGIVSDTIVGIDFDSDQQLWLRGTSSRYYRLGIHKDKMLVDYENKVIYFYENYDSVKVTSNG